MRHKIYNEMRILTIKAQWQKSVRSPIYTSEFLSLTSKLLISMLSRGGEKGIRNPRQDGPGGDPGTPRLKPKMRACLPANHSQWIKPKLGR